MQNDLDLLKGMLAHDDRRFRMMAIRQLLVVRPPDLEPLLIDLSRESYHGIRSVAAWALGEIRCEAAVPRLVELIADGDSWVRRAAAIALAKLGAREALPGLAKLKRDRERLVRQVAVWAERVIQAGGMPAGGKAPE